MIVGGIRLSASNKERIRTIERDIKSIKEDKRELFERTRFMITSQEFLDHFERREEKIVQELREMRSDVTDIRMRCAGCNTRASDRGI